KKLDEIAYVRFASVYRQFRDINEFMTELKELLLKKNET
ncbi:MAG TPA: transcriptional regulator NrdR, partial [Syntrophorhabdaceae bacterium]|nr:transcriptional regulator NrdR [Syntrophorhabdaceae bacterium]